MKWSETSMDGKNQREYVDVAEWAALLCVTASCLRKS